MNRNERNDLAALDTIGVDLYCQKCKARLGRIVDNTYLVIENTRFWEACRFTCRCGRSIKFKPIEPNDITSLKGYTGEILAELGRNFRRKGN